MSSRIDHSRHSTQLLGAAGVVVVAAVCALLIATYLQTFAGVVRITVVSDRAGLLLEKGARVRMAGVAIGEVRGSELRDDGKVDIDVAIDDDKAAQVPADVQASIRATTVFGSKFIDLEVPKAVPNDGQDIAGAESISGGDVITADAVTVEVNDVFQHGIDVLQDVDPAALDTTLTAVSTALHGRGEEFGQFFDDWNAYFTALQPHLDTLDTVLQASPAVLQTYADVAPALINTADNLGKTGATLAANRDQFEALLADAISGADSARQFLIAADAPLRALNDQWLPVTALGAEYSPEFTCLIHQLDRHRQLFSKFWGNEAADEHYFYTSTGFLPGQKPYTLADNAPRIVTGVGPRCYRGGTDANPTVPRVDFNDGTSGIYDNMNTPVGIGDNPVALYNNMLSDWLGDGGRDALLGGLLP
jgi:phospholipid/cholesterol/gamma-HCH transport system substrate-binding protein